MSEQSGAIKWFDPVKGFGFITQDNGGDDVFVHHSDLLCSKNNIAQEDRVTFETETTNRGVKAVRVQKG